MHWIITTDMDGTLLNHDDYRWQAAAPCIAKLGELSVPIILNTSKTYAEVRAWVNALNISHPFIVENGSAIFCPIDYFADDMYQSLGLTTSQDDGYVIIELGCDVDQLLAFKSRHAPHLESLLECSLSRAIAMTGLSETEARAAQQRRYTLPLFTPDQPISQSLMSSATEEGLQIVQGGRFAHLMSACDKWQAIELFRRLYQRQTSNSYNILALGDSSNDRAMLESADQAVIIKNHNNNWLTLTNKTAIKTNQQAPEGWVEGITSVLADDYPQLKELK